MLQIELQVNTGLLIVTVPSTLGLKGTCLIVKEKRSRRA